MDYEAQRRRWDVAEDLPQRDEDACLREDALVTARESLKSANGMYENANVIHRYVNETCGSERRLLLHANKMPAKSCPAT